MQLLNSRANRLTLYMADFSRDRNEKANQLRDINAADTVDNSLRIDNPVPALPLSAAEAQVAAERAAQSAAGAQVRIVGDAINKTKQGIPLTEAEKLAAYRTLSNLAAEERNARQSLDTVGQTPLEKYTLKAQEAEKMTRNSSLRVQPDGSFIPIESSVSPSSAIGQKLTEVAERNNPRIQAEKLRDARLIEGSPEDIARQQREFILRKQAVDVRKEQDRLVASRATASEKGAYTKAKNAMESEVLDAKRGLLSGNQRLANGSDRKAAYKELIAENGQRPSSDVLRERLAQKGLIDPKASDVQAAMGGIQAPRTQKGGVSLPNRDGTLLERKQRSIKNAQQKYNPTRRDIRSNNTFLDNASKELAALNSRESWSKAAMEGIDDSVPALPVPSYAMRDADGNIRTDSVQLNPKRGGALERRVANLDLINNAVRVMAEGDDEEFIRNPESGLNRYSPQVIDDLANGVELKPVPQLPAAKPAVPTPSKVTVNLPLNPSSVTSNTYSPSVPSIPSVNTSAPNIPNMSNPNTSSSPFWSQVRQGMNQSLPPQTRQQAKQAIGQARQRIASTAGAAANAYNNAQQRRQAGIQQRQAQVANIPPTPTPNSPPQATTSPPQTTKKVKKSKSFKGSIKTPSGGTYEAEISTPDWVEKAVLNRGGKNAKKPTNKNIEIPNEIVDSKGLLGRAKDFYNGLGNKKALLGGGAVLGGAGLLGLGAMKAAGDRNAAESRAKELAEVASRPPAYAMQPQPPQYNPYTY